MTAVALFLSLTVLVFTAVLGAFLVSGLAALVSVVFTAGMALG